jgi:hypothetical protein
MAGFLVKLPKVAVEQLLAMPTGPIVETAAKLVTFIAVVCFASFMYAMWLPKVAVTTKHSGGHRLQTSLAGPQKKKNRAKRNKKTRNVGLSKAIIDVEVLSEEDEELEEGLELVKDQADVSQPAALEESFDEEAPRVPHDTSKTVRNGKLEAIKEAIAGNENFGHLKEPVDANMQERIAMDDHVLKPTKLQKLSCEEIENQGTMRFRPRMPAFDCADHRQYATSLLLMHRELHLRLARGPPGLPKPTGRISPATAGLRCVCMSEVQARPSNS